MDISAEILPSKMLELFQEAEFENIGRVLIEKLERRERQVLLMLLIETSSAIDDQRWSLIIENSVEERLVGLEGGWLAVYDEHCLLWEYTDGETELYVNGRAASSAEYVSAKFYELHRVAFGEWLSLEKYINSTGLLFASQMTQGLFARGPKQLLSQYKDWLNELGKPAYLYESDGLATYNARKEKLSLHLLTIGESYFIGTQFLFQEITN